jgi:hypothetical protein
VSPLRVRLFGEEGERKIQIAARPSRPSAERANVLDHPGDFVIGQRIHEGRHSPIEGTTSL